MRRRALLAAVLAAFALAHAARAQTETPDATLTFHGRTATLGVGFSWGAGTLEFQGETYPVRVDGFVAGGLGTASIEASGQVFGLTKAEDLNGDFTAVATGAAFGRGAATLVMRNKMGVRVVMDGTMSGLQVGLGPRGMTLEVGTCGRAAGRFERAPPADARLRRDPGGPALLQADAQRPALPRRLPRRGIRR